MKFNPFRSPASSLFLLLLLASSPAFAQRDLKDIPDPDPELERQTFSWPKAWR